jgi:hypothetical protein
LNLSAKDNAGPIGVSFGARFVTAGVQLSITRSREPGTASRFVPLSSLGVSSVARGIMLRKIINTQSRILSSFNSASSWAWFLCSWRTKGAGWFWRFGFFRDNNQICETRNADAGRPVRDLCRVSWRLTLVWAVFSRGCFCHNIVEMIGAVLTIHIHNRFFMNWMGHRKGEGFRIPISSRSLFLSFLILGNGWLK